MWNVFRFVEGVSSLIITRCCPILMPLQIVEMPAQKDRTSQWER